MDRSKMPDRKGVLIRLGGYLLKYRGLLFLAFIMSLSGNLLSLVGPKLSGLAIDAIYTSDRRFPEGMVPKLRLMWKMNRLRKMYRDGVPIGQIAEMYRDVR